MLIKSMNFEKLTHNPCMESKTYLDLYNGYQKEQEKQRRYYDLSISIKVF
jgi:hypothetical protein